MDRGFQQLQYHEESNTRKVVQKLFFAGTIQMTFITFFSFFLMTFALLFSHNSDIPNLFMILTCTLLISAALFATSDTLLRWYYLDIVPHPSIRRSYDTFNVLAKTASSFLFFGMISFFLNFIIQILYIFENTLVLIIALSLPICYAMLIVSCVYYYLYIKKSFSPRNNRYAGYETAVFANDPVRYNDDMIFH